MCVGQQNERPQKKAEENIEVRTTIAESSDQSTVHVCERIFEWFTHIV